MAGFGKAGAARSQKGSWKWEPSGGSRISKNGHSAWELRRKPYLDRDSLDENASSDLSCSRQGFLGTSHAEWSVLKPPRGSNNKKPAWGAHGFNSTERYFFRKMLLSLRPNEGYAVTLAINNYLLRKSKSTTNKFLASFQRWHQIPLDYVYVKYSV